MLKRVALLTFTLFGAVALLPAAASAQDWRYDQSRRAYSDRDDRRWRDHDRRDYDRHKFERRDWREQEWRDNRPARYYYGNGGQAYFYYGTPQTYYGAPYCNR
ncbi:MAG: hypothetical protein JO061_22815 [Acidobacteriaceae bacterium]|nr:hypothetical protein [Acidobacteriaceae bacterium]